MRRKRPRYLDLLRRLVEETDDLRRPGVPHGESRHDDDCSHWGVGGTCDCDPTVLGGPGVDRQYGSDR